MTLEEKEVSVIEEYDQDGNPTVTIKSNKLKNEFIIFKEIGGYSFFTVRMSKGQPPAKLSCSFTGLRQAKKAVLDYVDKAKPSATVRRDTNTAEREARKVAKANSTSN